MSPRRSSIQAELPVVETQTVRRQAVLENKTIAELPAARGYGAILAAIPTLQGAGANSSSSVNPSFFSAHGGPGNEGRVMLDGLSVGAAFNGGGVSGNAYDTANAQEMQVAISGSLGEAEIGGPMLNIVPKTGGNIFSGTVFGSGAGEWAQGSNIDDELRGIRHHRGGGADQAVGCELCARRPDQEGQAVVLCQLSATSATTPTSRVSTATCTKVTRRTGTTRRIRTIKTRTATAKTVTSFRLTTQATPRNKFSFYYDYQWDCDQGSQSRTEGCRTKGDDYNFGTVFGSGLLLRGEHQLLGRTRDHLAGDLVVAGDQQAAPRGRLRHLRQPLGLDAAARRRSRTWCR